MIMDVIFDKNAAEELISQMGMYCTDIVKESRDILDMLNSSDSWKDRQRSAFQNNMEVLSKDMEKVLTLESDYMRTFIQRVKELGE